MRFSTRLGSTEGSGKEVLIRKTFDSHLIRERSVCVVVQNKECSFSGRIWLKSIHSCISLTRMRSYVSRTRQAQKYSSRYEETTTTSQCIKLFGLSLHRSLDEACMVRYTSLQIVYFPLDFQLFPVFSVISLAAGQPAGLPVLL